MNQVTEAPKYEVANLEDSAMTLESVLKQVKLIQQVMKGVMKTGEHYGTIPGCGDKPTLLKPGAEKLCTTFRLAPRYDIKQIDYDTGHREYIITTSLYHIPTENFIGQGVGSCSSKESKYRYRTSNKKCPECEEEAIIKGKEEFGGGWLCFTKKGGCGAKWKDGDNIIEGQVTGKTEYEDPADCFNTVLKMGKKRSLVDAVLNCTAASDIFTQDIEEMEGLIKKQEIKKAPETKQAEKVEPSKKKDFNALTHIRKLKTKLKDDTAYYKILEDIFQVKKSDELNEKGIRDFYVALQKEIKIQCPNMMPDDMPVDLHYCENKCANKDGCPALD